MLGAKRFAKLGLLLAPALVSLVVSCVLDGFNRVESDPVPLEVDAGMDAADAADEQDSPLPCVHAAFPSKPDASAGGTLSFVVAVRSIDPRHQPDGGAVGIDIDETCSCQGQGPSCVGAPDADSCDLPEGRDNRFADLFGALGLALGTTDAGGYYSQLAEEGNWSLLIRVRDYNGVLDDGQVEVSLFVPAGLSGVDAGPAWTGDDRWFVSGASVHPSDAGPPSFALEHPLYVDPNGYVSGGILVAGMPEARFVFGGSATRMELHATAINLMARINRDNAGTWSLTDGLLTGILPLTEVFAALGSFRNGDGNPVCTNQVAYDVAKRLICTGADLVASFSNPQLNCDSLSMGIGFAAVQARLGPVIPADDATAGCEPAFDPTFDQCP